MIKAIRNFYTPPVFEDEEKTRIARMLFRILTANYILLPTVAVAQILNPASGRFFTPIVLIISIIVTIFIAVAKRGYIRPVSVALLVTYLSISTITEILAKGEMRPVNILAGAVIITGGLLLGPRGSFITAILYGIKHIAVLFLINSQIFVVQTAIPAPTPTVNGTITFVGYLIIAVVFNLASNSIYAAVTSLRQSQSELKNSNQKLQELTQNLEKRIEERTRELREAQEKLVRNEKLAVLGQLAGGVGHELRNPLAVINSALYYLKLIGANGNEKVKEYLGIIQAEAYTAEKIITDLLDFARVKSVDDVKAVPVSESIRRTLERFPAPLSVNVTLEIPEDLPRVYVDPRQMEQVLGNLVINACQAMSAGGELTITAQQEQEMVAIAVKDTGVGISPENMKKLFEPLFTTKAKGIGLGLAVSQKLTEANGGRIEVESEVGKGSIFTLVMPVTGSER